MAATDSKPHVCYKFEVEKIIGISDDGNYQVQWAPAWVSRFHLVGCEHLIQDYLQRQSRRGLIAEGKGDCATSGATDEFIESVDEVHPISECAPEEKFDLEQEILEDSREAEDDEHRNTHFYKDTDKVTQPSTFLGGVGEQSTDLALIWHRSTGNCLLPGIERSDFDEGQPHSQKFVPAQLPVRKGKDDQESEVKLEIDMENLLSGTRETLSIKLEEDTNSCSPPSLEPSTSIMQVTEESQTFFNKQHHSEIPNQSLDELPVEGESPDSSGDSKGTSSYHTSKNSKDSLNKSSIGKRDLRRQFLCKVCSKSFTRYAYLKKHSLIHTNERPYKCLQCDSRFTQSNHLKIHLRTHTGEKPYTCEICGKSFSQNNSMKRHLLIHANK